MSTYVILLDNGKEFRLEADFVEQKAFWGVVHTEFRQKNDVQESDVVVADFLTDQMVGYYLDGKATQFRG